MVSTIDTITIVLSVIKSSVGRSTTALRCNYAADTPQYRK